MNDAVKLGFINKGIYNVINAKDMTKEQSNGYFWYEVEPDLWCAGGDWLEVLNPEAPTVEIKKEDWDIVKNNISILSDVMGKY